MKKTINIGTRGSQLALYQANTVKEELEKHFPNQKFSIVIIKTKGDKILDVALSKIGDKGLFTKEIENALTNGEIDMAIHSLKDLPTVLPDNLELSGVLKRGEFRDALVSINGKSLSQLDETDVIATSSLRRKSQLLSINPNFKIVDIRGNVNTRLQKMKNGHCTAMVMAAAGLQRIGLSDNISEILDKDIVIPAVSQGIIAIETRKNDNKIKEYIQKINHPETFTAGVSERTFLNVLEGGCQVPIGAYTEIKNDKIRIKGFISMPDGSKFVKDELSGNIQNHVELAKQLAMTLYNNGADEVVDFLKVSKFLK